VRHGVDSILISNVIYDVSSGLILMTEVF
jgi:hypothetical protein